MQINSVMSRGYNLKAALWDKKTPIYDKPDKLLFAGKAANKNIFLAAIFVAIGMIPSLLTCLNSKTTIDNISDIRKELKEEEAKKEKELKEEAKNKAKEDFKAICDMVVLKKGYKTVNVAEMLVFLCTIRREDDYDGLATVETLAEEFQGLMDIDTLNKCFEKLHNNGNEPCYLGKNYGSDDSYWLRPEGLEMIQKLYPDITLPPKKDRFIRSLLDNFVSWGGSCSD